MPCWQPSGFNHGRQHVVLRRWQPCQEGAFSSGRVFQHRAAWRVAGRQQSVCFYSANAEVMRTHVVCSALIIAQVTSLEPRRMCTRCHVHSTAATVPHVLGQTTHPWVDRHDRLNVCSYTQPRLLVGPAPRVQLRMKLGAQEVQAALRQTQQRFAGGFARARAVYVSLLRRLNSVLWPRLSAKADQVFSKGRMDAWSLRIAGQEACLIGAYHVWGWILVASLWLRHVCRPCQFPPLQMRICNWQFVWSLVWSSCVMWLFFYCGSWSFIEHHIWREESRRRRWGEDCKELFSSVLTPNLGWALEALEIDTLEGLTLREAQSAFHRLAKRYHPDVTGQARASAEQFKDLNEAYDAIKQHLQSASATV